MYILCKYFLPVCGLFFLSLYIVFHREKFLILMKFSISVLSFTDWTFGVVSEKSLTYLRSSRFSPRYLSMNSVVFCFIFRSLIQFELIFVKCVNCMTGLIFLHVDVQLFQYHLLKRLSLLHSSAFVRDQLALFLRSLPWWSYCPINLCVYSFTSYLLQLYSKSWSPLVSVFQLYSSSVLSWLFYLFFI